MTRTDTPALPAPDGTSRPRTPSPIGAPGEALVSAQQDVRRGLKAGRSALVHAKSAYGEAQWSGDHDRRPEPGLLVRAKL